MIYSTSNYQYIFYYVGTVPGYREICISSLSLWLGGTGIGNSVGKIALYSFGTDLNSTLYSSGNFDICIMQP